MLTTLEIKTVVRFALSRADYFFSLISSQWFKCCCKASVFQSASYQKYFDKDKSALWNLSHMNILLSLSF